LHHQCGGVLNKTLCILMCTAPEQHDMVAT
jgi:hypothetical protein